MIEFSSALLRIAIGLTLFLPCTAACEEEAGYVIIEAKLADRSRPRQPTWISLRNARIPNLHIPADATIVTLNPGRYQIHHVDFGASPRLGGESVFLRRPVKIRVFPGAVTVVGLIELSRSRGHIKLKMDEALLERACEKNQSAIDSSQVYIAQHESDGPIRVRCSPPD